MSNEKKNIQHANASVPAAAVFVDGTFTVNDGGFSNVVRNGAGDYSLTCDAIDSTECVIKVTARGAAVICGVVHTSDTVKQVLILDDTGAASDTPFDISILRVLN